MHLSPAGRLLDDYWRRSALIGNRNCDEFVFFNLPTGGC